LTVSELLGAVERGAFPPADAGLTLLRQPNPRDASVFSLTGHIYVIADVDQSWLDGHLRPGELAEAYGPAFLGAICAKLDRRVNAIDLLAVAPAGSAPGGPELDLTPVVGLDHPRVHRANRYRTDCRVFTVPGGVLVLGRGFGGRWEVAIEVDPANRSRGLGRSLAAAARRLAPAGVQLWAQITPGNAASVRAFLAAGYRPVGQEALLVPDGSPV
jgi:GNAT superfamily N-acetyltransferase